MPEVKQCEMGVRNETRINNLEGIVAEIKDDVREIKDKLLKRPSWSVAILISAMASAITLMASAIVLLVMELAKNG